MTGESESSIRSQGALRRPGRARVAERRITGLVLGSWPLTSDVHDIEEGEAVPLGATWDGLGVNFALFSAHATRVDLCLFDEKGRSETAACGPAVLHEPDMARLSARGAPRSALRVSGSWPLRPWVGAPLQQSQARP